MVRASTGGKTVTFSYCGETMTIQTKAKDIRGAWEGVAADLGAEASRPVTFHNTEGTLLRGSDAPTDGLSLKVAAKADEKQTD